jgi:hypothetical protein
MRTLPGRTATTLLLFITGPLACGLDSQGLLATDAGTRGVTTAGGDAADPGSDDEGGPIGMASPDDGGMDDVGPIVGGDASMPPVPGDSGLSSIKDAAPDVPFTCSGCIATMCPRERAFCGAGSACLGYRDCEESCTSMGGSGTSSCATTCNSMHPGGEAAYGALTICALGCGVGCTAALTVGTP